MSEYWMKCHTQIPTPAYDIYDPQDAHGLDTIIATTFSQQQPLSMYRTANFEIKLDIRTYVLFRNHNNRNCVVVMFTSGNWFKMESHLGVRQLQYLEYIQQADAFLEE
ncbi:hypothetical protein PROFUN_15467 [Planoprotostelium fungivorum]|uniref:Uncharacterized protein n=1 Tax=Planoprotostelium fungivorum TaxID=1890364 RepID=A0A2P6MW25_9EUKA|nr:hypothetical protein PROFUN_15467 [Planoprotostelium fungivorum]